MPKRRISFEAIGPDRQSLERVSESIAKRYFGDIDFYLDYEIIEPADYKDTLGEDRAVVNWKATVIATGDIP